MFGRSREVEENLNGFAHSRRTSTRATSKSGTRGETKGRHAVKRDG